MQSFEDTKSPLASFGVLGGLGALIIGVAQFAGWAVTPADAANLSELLQGLAVAVTGIVAVWGRMRASKRIVLK